MRLTTGARQVVGSADFKKYMWYIATCHPSFPLRFLTFREKAFLRRRRVSKSFLHFEEASTRLFRKFLNVLRDTHPFLESLVFLEKKTPVLRILVSVMSKVPLYRYIYYEVFLYMHSFQHCVCAGMWVHSSFWVRAETGAHTPPSLDSVQGYLPHQKTPPPQDHTVALCLVVWPTSQGEGDPSVFKVSNPKTGQFLASSWNCQSIQKKTSF